MNHKLKETLAACHNKMNARKASGVDKITKEMYAENLDENIKNLVARMKRQIEFTQLL